LQNKILNMSLGYIIAVALVVILAYFYFFEIRPYNYQAQYVKQGGMLKFNSGQDFLAEMVSDQSITGDITSHYKKMLMEKESRFFVSHIRGRGVVILNDADMIREVLTNPDRFPKDPYFTNIMKYIGRNSLLFAEGDQWKSHRKMLLCGFSATFVQNFIPQMIQYTSDLCVRIKAQNLKEIDIVTECESIVGQVFGRLMFGNGFKVSKIGDVPLTTAPQKGIEELFRELVRASLTKGSNKEAVLTNKGNEALVLIQKAKQKYRDMITEQKNNPNIDKVSYLYMLFEQQRLMPNNCFDDEEIIDQFMALAGMASYATSQQIAFVLYNLASHQFTQAKVKDEMEEVIKSDTDITFENINKLNFLHAVLKESLRLTNPKGIFPRIALKREKIQGIYIEQGHSVVIMPELMHIDPLYYADPEKFDPERWMKDGKLAEGKKHETIFSDLAFSAGPNHCIGRHFSNIVTKVVTVTLLRNYELKKSDKMSGMLNDCSLFGSKHLYSLKVVPI
jgi:cytochrome P450